MRTSSPSASTLLSSVEKWCITAMQIVASNKLERSGRERQFPVTTLNPRWAAIWTSSGQESTPSLRISGLTHKYLPLPQPKGHVHIILSSHDTLRCRWTYTKCTVLQCMHCVYCMYCVYSMYCMYCVYSMYCIYCMYCVYCMHCVYCMYCMYCNILCNTVCSGNVPI